MEDLRRIDFDEVAGSDLLGISTITSTAPRLKPKAGARISVDYREDVSLEL